MVINMLECFKSAVNAMKAVWRFGDSTFVSVSLSVLKTAIWEQKKLIFPPFVTYLN